MQLNAPGLCNSVLRLEVFGDAHLDDLKTSGAIEAMWDWMPDIPKGLNLRNYADHVADAAARGDLVPFAIYRAADGAFAGVAAFDNISRVHRRLRINYFWHPEEMRGTLVFPATQMLLIERALAWGARRIGWMVSADNRPAIQALERLGAVHEGTLRSYQRMADGRWSDMAVLSLLRDEAEPAVREMARRLTR